MKTRQKTGETGHWSADMGHDGLQVRRHQSLMRSIGFRAFNLKKSFQHNSKEAHDDEVKSSTLADETAAAAPVPVKCIQIHRSGDVRGWI